jgi:hypothetical protein
MIRLWLLIACLAGCERNRRMEPDQQIGLIEACEQARREAMAAPDAEREAAIGRWAVAIQSANRLCTNDLHDALVMKDDKHHQVALQVLRRVEWRDLAVSFQSDLESDRVTADQKARVVATLKAVSGQDLGADPAAWASWLRSQR